MLTTPNLLAKLEKIIFRETGTLGIRRWPLSRHKLERRPHQVTTQWGPVDEVAVLSDGSLSFSPEFEACRKIAAEQNLPLKDVYETALRVFESPNS